MRAMTESQNSRDQFQNSRDYIDARNVGEWRLPPGLRHALPYYVRRPWVSFGEPIPLFEHLQATFGRIAHYRFMGTTIVFVNDPELIQEVLINQAGSFVKERTLRRMKILLGEGLITSDDPVHMRQRRIAAPGFHRQRVAGYADEIVSASALVRDSWQNGAVLDISAAMMDLSLRIVARTLFDLEVNADVLSIADEVNTIMGLYNFLVAFPKLESVLHWPIPGVMQFRRSRARLDAIVARMIASRRRLSAEQLADRTDLTSMLIAARDAEAAEGADAMTDQQVRDEVLTIFLAGYETVANALAWTWYLLTLNQACGERMAQEVEDVLGGRAATVNDYPRLAYTESVFAESMRLYPPAWAMGRMSTAPVTLGEYRLPPGSHFFMSQYVMHRSAEFWEAPLEFRPERHSAEAKATRQRFVYFPFGGGRRQCIGEGFAWMEGVLALATIAQRWRFEFVPQYPVVPQAKITLRPKFPMMMRLHER
jgi:cytochrome P450